MITIKCRICGKVKGETSFEYRNDTKWYRTECRECRLLGSQCRKHGTTPEWYRERLKEQDSRCAICKIPSSELKGSLAIDHCHTTGKLRGLLCTKCNLILGLFNDDPGTIERAIRYLQQRGSSHDPS